MRIPPSSHSLGALALSVAPAFAGGPSLPPGFITELIGTTWKQPTGIAFIDAGRLLVAQKNGNVFYVENDRTKNLALDLRLETLNNGDRGILGIAVSPDFATTGFVYLLLVVDPDQDGVDDDWESFSRIVRFTFAYDGAGNLVADPLSRADVLGSSWATGIPSCHDSHAVGTIRFLSDGSLVLSHGDGAHYDLIDAGGNDPGCFGASKFTPDQDIGAFRSQYDSTLAGKILRIDPLTGLGLPDNPFYDGDSNSIRSRIWALGLRNPFRFCLVPGSGPREVLFVSDVGWTEWEEIELCAGGENFGWPCYEGVNTHSSYQSADPFGFCAAAVGTHVDPWLTWNHWNPSQAGFTGSSATGIAVYTGSEYPPLYQGALFFMDYSGNWLRYARLDANLNALTIGSFGASMGSPVCLETEPGTSNLVYVALANPERIYRIRYVGNNAPPLAVASVNPAYGPAPLTVDLVGSGSSDPDGDALAFLWDLGDGSSATTADVQHVYPSGTTDYVATLTVTDTLGHASTAEVRITPDNTPPSITSLDSPANGALYQISVPVDLSAAATDLEDDAASLALDYAWHVDLHHDHHVHPDTFLLSGPQASFTPDELYDGTWYAVRLEVTDSRGLVASQALEIYDAATVPKAHIAGSPDFTPRLGNPFQVAGHMEFPGNPPLGPTSLEFDWGDGTSDVFPNTVHQMDAQATHVYARQGTYELKLRARAGTALCETETTVEVLPKRPAVAIFRPLIDQEWISWYVQEDIANALVATCQAAGAEVQVFGFDEQQELVQWMTPFLDDGVRDVLVLLDFAPALVYAGENDGSLAETWMERGNGIVWTGQTPFNEYLFEDGTSSIAGAGANAADELLDAALASIANGTGLMDPGPRAEVLPSFPNILAVRALRYDQLGPEWKVGALYVTDTDMDSDGIALEHVSRGFYAQFLCKPDDSLPRSAVLSEFLKGYLFVQKKLRPAQGPPTSAR
jgi:glucose/arabinose dehydrogenase